MKFAPGFLAALFLPALASIADDAPKAPARGKAEHVVLIVWDGMRPDFATDQYAPTLSKLAQAGVFFQNNHAAYQ